MGSPVKTVIYFYIFVCVSLLAFNLLYIFRAEKLEQKQKKRQERWIRFLDGRGPAIPWKHLRSLVRVDELMAFQSALEYQEKCQPGYGKTFFQNNRGSMLELAAQYRRRPPMEQAFFSYVVARSCHPVQEGQDPLILQILGFLEHSTVYSRENILQALYALGNAQAVEHAFIYMSENGWYHDPRLLFDGLDRFKGDKDVLARRLWESRDQMAECFQTGVVRFITGFDHNGFAEAFQQALETEDLPTETRFALVRYFRRHPVPEAGRMLLSMLEEDQENPNGLAIAAAASLASYPGQDTMDALKKALGSPAWYVRHNAALSLKALGITWEEACTEYDTDRYGGEKQKESGAQA